VSAFISAYVGSGSGQGVNVVTWHNDNGRTGQNASETVLTTANVNKTNFGQLCSYPVDGQVYAQPLVLWDSINNRNLVYVVTQKDSIYLFDGTTTPVNKTCPLVASNTSLEYYKPSYTFGLRWELGHEK
jgi:hypothetical protein